MSTTTIILSDILTNILRNIHYPISYNNFISKPSLSKLQYYSLILYYLDHYYLLSLAPATLFSNYYITANTHYPTALLPLIIFYYSNHHSFWLPSHTLLDKDWTLRRRGSASWTFNVTSAPTFYEKRGFLHPGWLGKALPFRLLLRLDLASLIPSHSFDYTSLFPRGDTSISRSFLLGRSWVSCRNDVTSLLSICFLGVYRRILASWICFLGSFCICSGEQQAFKGTGVYRTCFSLGNISYLAFWTLGLGILDCHFLSYVYNCVFEFNLANQHKSFFLKSDVLFQQQPRSILTGHLSPKSPNPAAPRASWTSL